MAAATRSLDTAPATAGVPGCTGVHPSQYLELNPRERALVQTCAYHEMRASQAAAGWVLATGSPPAFYLYDFVLTYDSGDGYVLLFGSPIEASPTAPAQTWSYRDGNWTELDPGSSPAACVGSVLANDPTDDYVVYLAGTTQANGSACPAAGDTWGFHAGRWTQFNPTTSPSPRSGASFTNDSADGYLVLFGGISSACGGAGNVCNDTWTFSGGNWTELHPSVAPSNRSSAGMTYDATDGYVLLYGGEGPNGTIYTMLNDTWSFSAGTWTEISTAQAPPQPQPDGLTYDYGDGYAFYTQVCGNTTNDYRSEVTWKYSAGNWSAISGSCSAPGSNPPQRLGEGTTYDPVDGYVLLFGGGGIYFAPAFHDTWTYRTGTWTNRTVPGFSFLPYDGGASVTYDPADQAVLLFGGYNYSGPLNTTWEYASGHWTKLASAHAPSPRDGAGMVYDATDGYVVLFGGYTSSGAVNDTWEFAGGDWVELTPSTAPPPGAPGMVYDGADGYVLLYTGAGYSGTWTFHAGVWTNITATAGPGPGKYAVTSNLAYDATDGYVVQFAQYVQSSPSSGFYTNDTWKFVGGSWTNLTASVVGAPTDRESAGFAGMGPTGGIVLFGGYCEGCSNLSASSETWLYSGLNWSLQLGTTAPTPRYNPYLVYDAALGAGMLFGGYVTTGQNVDDLWLWEGGAAPRPFVTAFTSTPSVVDEGVPTVFSVSVVGGTSPLTYAYTGLPAGCSSANTSQLTCRPAPGSAGRYTVGVVVSDALGNRSNAYVGLEVNPRPSVRSFVALPANFSLGGQTILSVSVVDGTAPYFFVYAVLPPGCSTQTVPALPCTPTVSGNYTPVVSVYDSEGVSANASVTLTVVPLTDGALTLDGFQAIPSALILGNTAYLNASARSGVGPVTFTYSSLPTGCASSNVSSLLCTPTASGSFEPTVTVSDPAGDSLGLSTALTVYPAGGGGVLSLQAYGAAPALLTLGGSTVLYVSVSGARGTLTYLYSGLPDGCASQNVSALPCTPTRTGTFPISVQVTDSAGSSVRATIQLTVLPLAPPVPPLVIRGFSVAPNRVQVGSGVTFVVTASGGSGALAYDYLGLPPGCASANASTLSCQPRSAGTYGVLVSVADGRGDRNDSSVVLTVLAAVVPPPGAVSGGGGWSTSGLALVLAGTAAVAAGVAGVVTFLGVRRRNDRPRP